ncbi:MAG: FG-GAP repeat protein [Chitinophagaceae bacterium]|nr:FG-GAP repeat protein [Chitinophagaceae bacterium]
MQSPIQLLAACFILVPMAMKEKAPVAPHVNSARFRIPVIKHQPAPANNGMVDTASLKKSGWYSNALKNIEESEYQFSRQEDSKTWYTANRHQGLRFFYTEEGFTVQPRTIQFPVDENDGRAMPGKTKYRHLPGWKIQFGLDRSYINNGHWQVSGNTAEYITPSVIVQYINNKEGMRQNFIVQKPLQNNGELNVGFSIKTKLKVIVKDNRLQFFHNKTNVLNYHDLRVWDACGKPLAAYFKENKSGGYFICVDAKDAVYPVIIDPVSTTPAAMLESNQANANMGISVSGAGDVNGDGYSDVIVGAYLYDNGQSNEGSVFIYHGAASGINTVSAARVESNQVNANLGWSVQSAGDVNGDGYSDIVAGAPAYSNGQVSEGAAYVYYGSATGINTVAAAILESNQADAYMGAAVAGVGDVNRDGYSDIIVGAYGYDNGEDGEGFVFIYHGSASGINTTPAATAESNQVDAQLGISVAGAGDVNGDGYSDVIACASRYTNGQINEGAGFVYHGSPAGINSTAAARVESNQVDAYMSSVAGAGDVNGDGYSDVIAGAYAYDNGQSGEGASFIYHGSAAGVSTTAALRLEINQASAQFGSSVSCAGDINGDGYSDVIIGSPAYDNGENNEGGAFVYLGSATGINSATGTILQSNQVSARLGASVAAAGDVNGDGYSDVIAGAFLYDNGETDEGGAFVYHGSAAAPPLNVNSILQSNQVLSQMGVSVASAGDVNGDGYSDVIAGAVGYDNGQSNEGAAFIFHGSATGISTVINAQVESNQANSQFGWSVAGAGDVNGDGYNDIVVGASQYNGVGAILIYHGSATGISTIPAAIIESGQAGAGLGISVAGAGDINGDGFSDVIAGAYAYDNGQNGEGAAFIYYGSNTGTVSAPNTRLESNQVNAAFGNAVAGAGDVNGDGFSDVIVGARLYDNGQAEEGAVFIYHGSTAGIITTPVTFLECNQAGAEMGYSVAAAGDINADGYGDIIAGAYLYDNGQTDEGAAFIYHGSGSGISNIASAMIESNQNNAVLGISVAGAGDLNGDGYADVMAGAVNYMNGQISEGSVFIYDGSPAGISTIPVILESNLFGGQLGSSAACAGDVNADGYSDLIIGASGYSNPEATEGAAFIYHGNNPGTGIRNNLRLYNADLITPMQQSNVADPNLFGAGLYTKSPQGRQKGKLVWETVANGNPFSGSLITNSVSFTTQSTTFADLGLTGTELKKQVAKRVPAKATYIRARVKYDLTTSITGQVYGPWRYPTGFLQGRRDVGSVALPVKFIAFTVQKKNDKTLLRWITAEETAGVKYEVQHSTDGIHFTTIQILPSLNTSRSEYEWLHAGPSKGNNYYRIRATELDKEVFTTTRQLTFGWKEFITIYPNPVRSGGMLTVTTTLLQSYTTIQLLDTEGRLLQNYKVSPAASSAGIKLPELPAGVYFLKILDGENKLTGTGTITVTR